MRLDGFTVCTDGDDKVLGLQFFLTETPYLVHEYARLLNLNSIGVMTGDCRGMRFSDPVHAVKAASKRNSGIQGLQFYYGDQVATIGDMDGWKVNTQTWTFND